MDGSAGPGRVGTRRGLRGASFLAAGSVVGLVISASLLGSGWQGLLATHTECDFGARLGNVSAWAATFFLTAPFLGSVTGSWVVWDNVSSGTQTVRDTNFTVASGNVTGWLVAPFNWTIFAVNNQTDRGSGPSQPCPSSMEALVSSPAVDGGTTWTPIASNVTSSVGLPQEFNATRLCLIDSYPFNNPTCASTTTFELDYTSPAGVVDTCGQSKPTVLPQEAQATKSLVPFEHDGIASQVPVNPTYFYDLPAPDGMYPGPPTIGTAGATGWFNYTFPEDGGIWDYSYGQSLLGANAGPAFSYAPCPA